MSAKKFINDPVDVVEEMVAGVAAVHADALVRLEGHTVLLHRNIEVVREQQVTLLSGGGSGHEPAHAGFIGDGMLSGAVLGGVFASPSTSSVLAAIRASAGPAGCLLIVKNYTGDRINFGQAALMAQAEGFKVEMVVVADDCAVPEGKGVTGGRGVAGTVFVHKVAGAAAASGASLGEVVAAAKEAASLVKSLGTAFTTCTVPGTAPSTRLSDPSTIEVGLGIHGEPGLKQAQWQPAQSLVKGMLNVIVPRLPASAAGAAVKGEEHGLRPVALLVNNLGGTPLMELYIVAHNAVQALRNDHGLDATRIMVGSYMTSLEMQGVSLSVLPLIHNNDNGTSSTSSSLLLLARLDAPTSAPAWHPPSPLPPRPPLPQTLASAASLPDGAASALDDQDGKASSALPAMFSAAVLAACQALDASEAELTRWDQVAGDGDCGVTFQRGAKAVAQLCQDQTGEETTGGSSLRNCSNSASAFGLLADAIASSMGGTSGALLEIFFRAGRVHLLQTARTSSSSSSSDLAGAFVAGSHAVKDVGGAEAGMRTMLDALLPAADILEALPPAASTSDCAAAWASAVAAAESGAEATKSMEALAGRSNYISADLVATVPDPGAKAIAFAMRAALDVTTIA